MKDKSIPAFCEKWPEDYTPLFEMMSQEHGLTLLDGQMADIIYTVLGMFPPQFSTEDRPPTKEELEEMGFERFSSTPHDVEYRGNRLKVCAMHHHTNPSFRVYSNSFPSVYFPGVKSPSDLWTLVKLVNG